MQTQTLADGTQIQVLVDPAQGLRTWAHFGPFVADPVTTFAEPGMAARLADPAARIAFYTMCVRAAIARGPSQATPAGVP